MLPCAPILTVDKYKRRRPYVVVDNQNMCDGLQVALCGEFVHLQIIIKIMFLIADSTSGNLHTFLPIEKCTNLYGYKLIGYKEFIFLFGGEFYIGNGNWNKNFFVYDNVREKWERKCLLVQLNFYVKTNVGILITLWKGINMFTIIMYICYLKILFTNMGERDRVNKNFNFFELDNLNFQCDIKMS